MNRDRGFALLIVLWTLVLLALMVMQFTRTGRTDVRVAANLRASAVLQAAADGAVHEAILRLLQRAWLPDGRVHDVRVEGVVVEVRVRNQDWKVNPNTVPAPVMRALLVSVGVDAGKAIVLSRAMVDWRSAGSRSASGGPKLALYRLAGLPYGPANQPFDSLDEIGLVPGMTPVLLARLRPLLSVYQEGDAPEQGGPLPHPPDDGAAVADGGWRLGSTGRVMVVAIEASAASTKGGRFTRQAVTRLRAEASLDQAPYQILTWEGSTE